MPQGSCLGPLLFSIFTNDLPFVLDNSDMALYADDSTINTSAQTLVELNTILQVELKLIENWIRDNKMVINAGKSKCMVLGSKYLLKDPPVLSLTLGGIVIEQATEVKLIGVTVDSLLNWNSHVNQILLKMGRSLAVVKHCKKYILNRVMKRIVESLVLSHLDYCSIIWSSTTEMNLRKLQVAQNKAARVVLSCPFRTSVR